MKKIWLETIRDAWSEFSLGHSHTLFAFISIMIGTAAVISIFEISYMAETRAFLEFDRLGTDIISAAIHKVPDGRSLNINDVMHLPEKNMGIRKVTVVNKVTGKIRFRNKEVYVNFFAVDHNYDDINLLELEEGRFTYDIDRFSLYAVIGYKLNEHIKKETGESLNIGDQFTFYDKRFTVIGLLKEISQHNTFGRDANNAILIPLSTTRRLPAPGTLTRITARLEAGQSGRLAAQALEEWIQRKSPKAEFEVYSANDVIENMKQQRDAFNLLFIGTGSISLIISGVGIMSVMMMSVMRKRPEIGLRRALGATRGTILWFFLCNAFLLCLSGAIGGVVLGLGGGYLFSLISKFPFVISPMVIPLAIGMALTTGLFFGLYPAFRATQIDIVIALKEKL